MPDTNKNTFQVLVTDYNFETMRKKIFLGIAFLAIAVIAAFNLLFTSCSNGTKLGTTNKVIHIDHLEKISDSDIPPVSYRKEKRYVNLYSADIELNFKQISKIQIHNNHFYILDSSLSILLVYDFNGHAIAQIGKRGNGPNEYLDVTDFDIDKEGNIYIMDGSLGKLFIYDKAFRFIQKRTLPFQADIIKVLENGNYLFGLSSWNNGKHKGAKIIRTNSHLEDIQVLNVYDEYIDNSVWISNYTFSSGNNSILYNRPLDNEIFQFSNTGKPTGSLWFDFGKEEMPNNEKKDIMKYYHNLGTYNALQKFTIIEEDYLLGTFLMYGKTRSFFIDREEKKMYLGKESTAVDYGDVLGYHNKILISCIIPGTDKAEDSSLPTDVKNHLKADNFVLCLCYLL
jgi:hypothetical protein